ncbi:RNA 2',3'-cyclic phosphodiesterase [Pseudacidobacterium ailaaui]|uniref:RNA 2',3'-cyclic phosphodiesterase n=1 Tax=Pseudacidobacterium ailaaui TaxID=1382359 RepID=UPI00047E5D12|nr:RNA 2',3'-cyclic phosphodiesterase [Pseudacidobacterium ailaaui]
MRLFTALALDPETAEGLRAYVAGLRQKFPLLKWALPDGWHVTLQFLGEGREDSYAAIVKELRGVCAAPVKVRLGRPDFFARAGIFHVAVERTESLLALYGKTTAALARCGFAPEARPYTPHITLARRRGGAPSSDFRRLQLEVEKNATVKFSSFVAHEFLLYQSFTGGPVSRYEVRERFPLL